jgi:hypothetical protein
MTESERSNDREKSLQLMADYLKGKLADQLATTRDSDSKVYLRLTICAAVVGLVAYVLPPVGTSQGAKGAVYLLVGAFGFCLLQVLASALAVLKTRVNLPAVKGDDFRRYALDEQLTPVRVLIDVVHNYTDTAEKNLVSSKEREPHVAALRDWCARAVWAGFIAVGASGIVYAIADLNGQLATEKQCIMTDKVQQHDHNFPTSTPADVASPEAAPSVTPAATPAATPIAAPAAVEKPASIQAASDTIELTDHTPIEPIRGERVITKQAAEKKQE